MGSNNNSGVIRSFSTALYTVRAVAVPNDTIDALALLEEIADAQLRQEQV